MTEVYAIVQQCNYLNVKAHGLSQNNADQYSESHHLSYNRYHSALRSMVFRACVHVGAGDGGRRRRRYSRQRNGQNWRRLCPGWPRGSRGVRMEGVLRMGGRCRAGSTQLKRAGLDGASDISRTSSPILQLVVVSRGVRERGFSYI